jgi:c-di-GMP-binding flagellar brake protein YcgR
VEAPLVSFDPGAGIVKCRHTLKFKRNQLRQDVRVETDLMVNIRPVYTAKTASAEKHENFMAKMTDLSGGGFAFTAEQKLSSGDMVVVTASSSKLVIAGVQAKILGMNQNKTTQKFHYHAQFVNIEFDKKEKIIKYVFNRLRELTLR